MVCMFGLNGMEGNARRCLILQNLAAIGTVTVMEAAATSFLVHGAHKATVRAKSANWRFVRKAAFQTQKKKAAPSLERPS